MKHGKKYLQTKFHASPPNANFDRKSILSYPTTRANRAVNSPLAEQSDSVHTPSGQGRGARAKTGGSSVKGGKRANGYAQLLARAVCCFEQSSQACDRNVTAHGKSLRSGVSCDSRR